MTEVHLIWFKLNNKRKDSVLQWKTFTFIQLCQALPHIAKVFASFTFSHVIHVHLLSFRVFSLQKIECTFDGISIAFFASPNFWYLSTFPVFETSDSKRLPVKYSSQSDPESLDFDIDWPRGLASLVLTKRNAASGNEIGRTWKAADRSRCCACAAAKEQK